MAKDASASARKISVCETRASTSEAPILQPARAWHAPTSGKCFREIPEHVGMDADVRYGMILLDFHFQKCNDKRGAQSSARTANGENLLDGGSGFRAVLFDHMDIDCDDIIIVI